MTEAERKRTAALESAGPFATSDPADVRWLLCGRGRGRPVSTDGSPYTVVVTDDEARVMFEDIEASRVAAEERWEEPGYDPTKSSRGRRRSARSTPPRVCAERGSSSCNRHDARATSAA